MQVCSRGHPISADADKETAMKGTAFVMAIILSCGVLTRRRSVIA